MSDAEWAEAHSALRSALLKCFEADMEPDEVANIVEEEIQMFFYDPVPAAEGRTLKPKKEKKA